MGLSQDRLYELIVAADKDAVLTYLATGSATERAKLHRWIDRLVQHGQRWDWSTGFDEDLQVETQRGTIHMEIGGSAESYEAAEFARALCGDSKAPLWHFGTLSVDDAVRASRVLGPAWTGRTAERLAEDSRFWNVLRAWMAHGLIERPTKDGYYYGLLRFAGWHRGPKLYEYLKQNPDVVENELWHLFQLPGTRESSFASRDKYSAPESRFSDALLRLTQDGVVSRDRLLDECLLALARDFLQFRAGWFSRMHDMLEPTREERVARRARYLHLLGSTIGPTVAFALKHLTRLQKWKELPGRELLEHVAPAFGARAKSHVTRALRLVANAVRTEPALAPTSAPIVAAALGHERPDVQESAIALIESWEVGDDALREELRRHAEFVSPSVRTRLDPWLGAAAAPEVGKEPADFGLPRPAPDPLAPERAIARIQEIPELVLTFSRVLEGEARYADVERVLDAVVRIGAGARETHATEIGPLAKRARRRIDREASLQSALRIELHRLAGAWTSGDLVQEAYAWRGDAAIRPFVRGHVGALIEAAAAGRPATLLSAPTHEGGWIDPVVLVERRLGGAGLGVFDEVLALLRLAPARRDEALARANGLGKDTFARAVRHALGDPSAKKKWRDDPSVWAAAARARAPLEDDPEVIRAFPKLGPGGGHAGRVTPVFDDIPFQQTVGRRQFARSLHILTIDVEPAPGAGPPPEALSQRVFMQHPAALDRAWLSSGLPGAEGWYYGPSTVLADGCAEALLMDWWRWAWPANPEPLYAHGMRSLASNLDWAEARWWNRHYLEILLADEGPLSTCASTMLALGLASKEPGEQLVAAEALASAAAAGRLTAEDLGERMAWLLTTGLVKCVRWQKTLSDAAGRSAAHARFVAVAIQRALRGEPADAPRDLRALLECLHEQLQRLGAAMADAAARDYVQAVSTGGKTKQVRNALLAL